MGDSPQRRLHGKVERIGLHGTKLTFDDIERNQHDSRVVGDFDHRSAANFLIDWLDQQVGLASIAAALGGLDTLIFAGSIGENAPVIRARICDGLEFLGIKIDEKFNVTNAGVISALTSRVAVYVIHTDEEVMIAKSVRRVLDLPIEKENEHGHEDKKT